MCNRWRQIGNETWSRGDFQAEMTDSIWTMALALKWLQEDYDVFNKDSVNSTAPATAQEAIDKKKKSLADFTFARRDMAEELVDRISRLRFLGASVGLVSIIGIILLNKMTMMMIFFLKLFFFW